MSPTKILSNSVALLVLELVGKLIPLITLPYLTRKLGPEMYGKAGFAMSMAGFFAFFAAPGLAMYGTREMARDPEHSRPLINDIFGAKLIFATVAYALLTVYTFTVAPPDEVTRGLILLSGLGFFVACFDMRWILASESKMWLVSFAGIAAQLAPLVIMYRYVEQPSDADVFVAMSLLSAVIISAIVFAITCRRWDLPKPNFAPRAWAKLLPATITLSVASFMSMVYDQIDIVMLGYTRSEYELGLYTASTKVMYLGLSCIFFIGQVFFPINSQAANDVGQERKYLQWMLNGMSMIALPVTLAGVILAGPLCEILLGPQFIGAETLVRINMVNVAAVAFAIFCGNRLITHQREKRYLFAVFAGALLNVLINLLFLRTYGPVVASTATIISQTGVALTALYLGRDLVQPRWFEAVKIPVMSTSVMSVVMITVEMSTGWHLVAKLLIAVFSYSASYLFLHAVSTWRVRHRQLLERTYA